MAHHTSLEAISNPLVTSKQLSSFQQTCNYSRDIVDVSIHRASLLTQVAGVLLRLPQEVIATSIVILQRYLVLAANSGDASDGGFTFPPSKDNFTSESWLVVASSAAVYLAAKQSFYPLSPRSVINVFALLSSSECSPLPYVKSAQASDAAESMHNPKACFVSEGTYQTRREQMFAMEKAALTTLGFGVKVALPYNLSLTYLQALSASTPELSERVLAYLNSALLSPQLLYLTHQPNTLAVASIYLAAREQGVELVDEAVPWWEVFDVDREELGFLVLSLGSLNGFVESLK